MSNATNTGAGVAGAAAALAAGAAGDDARIAHDDDASDDSALLAHDQGDSERLLAFLATIKATVPIKLAHDAKTKKKARVVDVAADAHIRSALGRMSRHGLLALPVRNAQGEHTGFITVHDIIAYLVQRVLPGGVLADALDELLSVSREASALSAAKVSSVAGLAGIACDAGEVRRVMEDQPLCDVLALMAESGAHRVAVVGADGSLVNVITQSRLLQVIGAAREWLPHAHRAVGAIDGLVTRDVLRVGERAPVRAAFEHLHRAKVGAIAVVADDGAGDDADQLVGVLSAADVRALGYDLRKLQLVDGKVKHLLERVHARNSVKRPGAPRLCTVADATTFMECVAKMIHYRVHRVFVVAHDADDVASGSGAPPLRLRGVISITDVLKAIWKCRPTAA